ncbi:MAG TPA: hypothetical protein VF802_01435 [Candidatus Limnocylindrales bacterium]
MRRLALLLTAGAVWLFLAAIPVFADGGPHQAQFNNGSLGINADSCAGCHRFHSATSSNGVLLGNNASIESTAGSSLRNLDISEFCLTCHGAAGFGATTDVENGVQYYLSNGADPVTGTASGTPLGALRGGGFVYTLIGSTQAYRQDKVVNASYAWASAANPKVPVAASPSAVTSAHLAVGGNGINPTLTVWGNGANTTFGPTYGASSFECTSCHNPHGNGNYRILNPLPKIGTAVVDTTGGTGVNVLDDTTNTGSGAQTRNYTVIQVAGTLGSPSTYLLTAQNVIDARTAGTFNGTLGDYSFSSGDYLHRYGQYNKSPAYGSASGFDEPNGGVGSFAAGTLFNQQIDAWCVQCHTNYYSADRNTQHGVWGYQHVSYPKDAGHLYLACTTCHVAHGSSAHMDGTGGTDYSGNVVYPDGVTVRAGDSRLLKVDNRGTCQTCHDPTEGSAIKAVIANPTTGDWVPQGYFNPSTKLPYYLP